MRDIICSNGAKISVSQSVNNSKPTNIGNTGTLTNKGDYKSYKDFFENYNNKKSTNDDQESVSSVESGIFSYKLADSNRSHNTSSSSLNSEASGTTILKNISEQNCSFNNRTGSFRNYLDNYNNRKFGAVKLSVPHKTNNIKSEIIIQLDDPLQNCNRKKKMCQIRVDSEISDIEKESSPSVITSSIENRSLNSSTRSTSSFPSPSLPSPPTLLIPLPKSDTLINKKENFTSTPAFTPSVETKVLSISSFHSPPSLSSIGPSAISSPKPEIFSDCQKSFIPAPPPPPLPFSSQKSVDTEIKKKWSIVNVDGANHLPALKRGSLSADLDAAASLAKALQEHFLLRNIKTQNDTSRLEKVSIKEKSGESVKATAPKLATSVLHNLKLADSQEQDKNIKSASAKSDFKIESLVEDFSNLHNCKPPLRSSNVYKMSQKFQQDSSSDLFKSTRKPLLKTQSFNAASSFHSSEKSSLNNTEDAQHTRMVVPVDNNTQNVNKSDPNVKKLVYSTYRGLLSAYNNKANDMIATLPRKMVREDRGVSEQLKSMALHGGLEKLNGRINPKVNQE